MLSINFIKEKYYRLGPPYPSFVQALWAIDSKGGREKERKKKSQGRSITGCGRRGQRQKSPLSRLRTRLTECKRARSRHLSWRLMTWLDSILSSWRRHRCQGLSPAGSRGKEPFFFCLIASRVALMRPGAVVPIQGGEGKINDQQWIISLFVIPFSRIPLPIITTSSFSSISHMHFCG